MSADHETEVIRGVSILRLRNPKLLEFESIPATSELLEAFIQDSATDRLLICFGQIEFWNSMALGLVATLPIKASRHGKTISLCDLNPKSMWSIQATRLHELLDIYFDEPLALAAVAKQPG